MKCIIGFILLFKVMTKSKYIVMQRVVEIKMRVATLNSSKIDEVKLITYKINQHNIPDNTAERKNFTQWMRSFEVKIRSLHF